MTVKELIAKHKLFMVDEGTECKIECGEGLIPLIDDMCTNLNYVDLTDIKKTKIKVIAIKVKYGLMRTYFKETNDNAIDLKLSSVAHAYENKSSMVCSVCGKPARACKDRDRQFTLCDLHLEEKLKS